MLKWMAGILLGVMAIGGSGARGEAGLNEGLPEDTLGFVELNPAAADGGKGAGQNVILDLGLGAMESFGVLPKEAGVVGDALGLAAVAGEHRSCVALLDADLEAVATRVSMISSVRKVEDKGLMCKSVQVAWVIETGGGAEESRGMVERLTRLLDHLSTRETARQAVKKTAEGKREYVEFRDTRWPEWLTLAWTQQGKMFVVTMGAGAMEHYLADRAVGGVPWAETIAGADAEALRLGERGKVMARVYVAAKGFRERFPEVMAKTVLGRVFASLDLRGADAAVISVRADGRVMSLDRAMVVGGRMRFEPWTMRLAADSPLMKLVPAEASCYLALRMDWEKVYVQVTGVCDAVLKNAGEEAVAKEMETFALRQGVDVRKDILWRMSPVVVVHDSPAHPLRLPLMVTVVGAMDEEAKKAMGKLLKAAEADVEAKEAGKGAKKDFARFRLRTEKDGVMFMQFGLVGPGWAWEGNKWVFSWSPAAVRYNLPLVRGVDAQVFSTTKESPRGDR